MNDFHIKTQQKYRKGIENSNFSRTLFENDPLTNEF